MDAQRWAQIEEMFHRACECDASQRARMLREYCKGDLELRSTVEMLLAREDSAADNLQSVVSRSLDAVAFPLVGETISHYRILAGIDSGGMGSVYQAEDVKLGRRVALKFLAEEFASDSAALSRFEREARSASALEHPNICPIYEFGEHAGQPFLAMQLLQGQTLRELISRNGQAQPPFALSELLSLALQITAALDAAHRHGVVHRDIKPANIFITGEGQAKILDFGLAKPIRKQFREGGMTQLSASDLAEEHGDRGVKRLPAMRDAFLSRTGVALGTTAYMSPEQARGEELDARTDIYSLGLVLYEMATGHRAFEGVTEPVLHDAIFRETPAPVRRLNPTLPAEFETIVRRCLERNRGARYLTAAQLLADLEALRTKAVRKKPYRSGIAIAAGLALLTAVAWLWLAWRQEPIPQSPNGNLQQLTTNSWDNPVTGSALSPDGHYLAYTDTKGLHVKRVGSNSSQLVALPEPSRDEKIGWDIQTYAWFPDSRYFIATANPLAYEANWAPLSSSKVSTVWLIPAAGGAPRKLRDGALAWAVSPDGSMIAFGANSGRLGDRELWVMGPEGERVHKFLEVDAGRALCCMFFFKDGKRVSYVITDDSGDRFVTQDLSGGPVTTVMGDSEMRSKPDLLWLPDGRLIYSDCVPEGSCTYAYWLARFDIRSGRMTEPARRLTTMVGANVFGASATPDGRLLAFIRSTGSGTSYVADMEAGAVRIGPAGHFALDDGEDAIQDWMPDGRTAIIVSNRENYSSVYRRTLGNDVVEPIVARAEGAYFGNAVLTPDAKWIILLGWSGPTPSDVTVPRRRVWRVPVTGGALQELFSLPPGSGLSCARAPATLCVVAEPKPDHKQTVVSAFDPNTGARGAELLRFDRYPSRDEDVGPLSFALSPDGKSVSTSAAPAGPLRVLSLSGEPARVLSVKGLNVQQDAAWMPDGKGLIVTTYRDDAAMLLHVDLQGNAHELFRCASAEGCGGRPSPDGKHLGINQSWKTANVWMLENF